MRRVVITGIGAITPIGIGKDEMWNSLLAGKHGFCKIDRFDTSDIKVKIAAQVNNFDPTEFIDKKEARRMDRFCQFAVAAADLAIKDASTDLKDLDPYRVGVIFGSGIGGFETMTDEFEKFHNSGARRVSPFFIPMMITNMAAGTIAMKHQFKGTNYAPVTACASSTHAVGEAFHLIKHGILDAAITGGSEATISKMAVAGFANMKALSSSEDVNRASIPFDKERDGFIMGEGAGALILEEYDHAVARGATIYAEIAGYGATADAYHMTSPAPDGVSASKAMIFAYEEAGLKPEEIDYINAHGTSTPLNDKYETTAVKLALGDAARQTVVGSTKSMTGHLLGAAGAVETIITALAIQHDIIPQTIGFKEADEECDLDYATDANRQKTIRAALSNSLGFGGHNATICLKKV